MPRTWQHLVLVATALAVHATVAFDLRGLPPDVQPKFQAASAFTCENGKKTLPMERMNDNYCDCEDGADEPGTSACSHTTVQFHCVNRGFHAKKIPTSHVNDRICDCCDGSDEYSSGMTCSNTCTMRMAEHQAAIRARLDEFNRGYAERQKIVQNSTELHAKDLDEKNTLENEVSTQTAAVKHLESIKLEEEDIESEERRAKRFAVEKEMLTTLGLHELSVEQLGMMVLDYAHAAGVQEELLERIRKGREGKPPTAMDEEEAQWKKRDLEREEETKRIDALREKRREEKEAREKKRQEAIDRGETPPEEPAETEEELVTPVVEDRPIKKLFDKIGDTASYEREQARDARKAYTESNDALSKNQEHLDKLKTRLEKHFGDQDVLYSLYEQCFNTDPAQYTYTICIYGEAKQDSTSLGTMEPYDLAKPNELSFTHGTTCWNGPERSLTIKMECGEVPILDKVEEPSTCVYSARFRTPIVCDDKAKEKLLSSDSGGVVEVEVGVKP